MDDAVQASRLEMLLLNGDKPVAEIEKNLKKTKEAGDARDFLQQVKMSKKGKQRLNSLLNSRFK